MTRHVSLDRLEEALAWICRSPADQGIIEMIVRRPATNGREVLHSAELSEEFGLVGDNWSRQWPVRQERHPRHLAMQINLMNSRVIDAITEGDRSRWSLAGDQLFVDFDLSEDNLPAGSRLRLGDAVLEVTSEPHLGCRKFSNRFGSDAVAFVNSATGKRLKLRGINARIIRPGVVTTGGELKKLTPGRQV